MSELSHQAQAVLDAVEDDCIHPDDRHRIAAAALCAAVDQVVPSDPNMPERWEVKDEIRADLLAIVTELENHQ